MLCLMSGKTIQDMISRGETIRKDLVVNELNPNIV